MNISKAIWGIRCLLYSFFCDISFPGYIGKPVYISRIKGLHIGRKVRIYPGLRAEMVLPESSIIIGDNTSIGQNCHFVSYNSKLTIGSNVTVSGNVFISNCDHEYKNIGVHILNQSIIGRKTSIDDNCFIGYGSVILAGTKLGKQCIVGSNSVVRGSFPDYCVIAGNPARIVKKYDENNMEWVTQKSGSK